MSCSDVRPNCEMGCKSRGHPAQNCTVSCTAMFNDCLKTGSFLGRYKQTHGLVKK